MRERLVLWDVDHTLLNAGGLSSHLYGLVFAELFGRPLPQVAPMAGRTDRAIIVETLTLAGVADPRSYVPSFIEALTREAPAFGERVRARGQVLPGVPEALAALAAEGAAGSGGGAGRVWQSVLTGNIRPLAEVKLGALGLGAPLDLAIGAYGDMEEVRAGEGTVLVGDTPLDVAAALATGARAVAVATKNFTEAELAAAGAHAVLPDLSDTERVCSAILGSANGWAAS